MVSVRERSRNNQLTDGLVTDQAETEPANHTHQAEGEVPQRSTIRAVPSAGGHFLLETGEHLQDE